MAVQRLLPITTMEPNAKVEVDVKAKTVTVEAAASEETIKQAITAAVTQLKVINNHCWASAA